VVCERVLCRGEATRCAHHFRVLLRHRPRSLRLWERSCFRSAEERKGGRRAQVAPGWSSLNLHAVRAPPKASLASEGPIPLPSFAGGTPKSGERSRCMLRPLSPHYPSFRVVLHRRVGRGPPRIKVAQLPGLQALLSRLHVLLRHRLLQEARGVDGLGFVADVFEPDHLAAPERPELVVAKVGFGPTSSPDAALKYRRLASRCTNRSEAPLSSIKRGRELYKDRNVKGRGTDGCAASDFSPKGKPPPKCRKRRWG
jgi:hypothetical protein